MLTLHLTEDEAETMIWALWRAAYLTRSEAAQGGPLQDFRRSEAAKIEDLRQRVIDKHSVPGFAAHIDIE